MVRNAIKYGYPVAESLRSLAPLVDETVVAVGKSDDGTLELVRSLDLPDLRIIETVWDESLRVGGRVLAQQTNVALAQCRLPWAFYLQADEVVQRSGIPAVTGVSDYKTEMRDGKMVIEFPINVWPGWAPIIVANQGLEPSDQSVFAKKYGFYVRLAIVDDPVKARDLFASGQSHILWGTLDMIALFAPELVKDSRTVPVVCQQIDFSAGGDGVVARGEIRSINDLRSVTGKRKKVVLAQNSPSHYLIMSLLIDAGIDPGDIDFRWAADAPSAAKIFVQDPTYDAFVGWSPDIYVVTDKLKGTRLVVTTGTANHLIADVWAVRNDFYRDHPEIVAHLQKLFDTKDLSDFI